MITRRNFLKRAIKGVAGLSLPIAAIGILSPKRLLGAGSDKLGVRWVFLVNTYKCVGCGLCVKACKTENEIPYDANVTRTWVERYVLTKKGRMYADSPKGARDGFTTAEIDQNADGLQDISKE